MRIGCLAWGSLVWDPRTLPVAGPFRLDGPRLPIEFSRVSLDGRVTLVLDPAAPMLPTFWVPLEAMRLDEAIEALGERERIPSPMRGRHVGALVRGQSRPEVHGETDGQIVSTIAQWLESRPLDAVLWTALPPRGPAGEPERPDVDRLIAHLESLEEDARTRAEQYVRRAPWSVRTPRRAELEARFGWLPSLSTVPEPSARRGGGAPDA